MTREILVHLNVEAPEDDPRTANQIADAILAHLEVGAESEADLGFVSINTLVVVCPLAEEV